MARPHGDSPRRRRNEPAPRKAAATSLLKSSQTGPSTTRGRKTRAALVSGAREAFEELGFRDAKISDIAARAGTSYGVFYHYFDSKESILDELFTSVTGEMYTASQARASAGGDAVDKIRESNRQYLVVAARNIRLIAMIEELAYREPQFRELKLRIREPFLRRNEAGIRSLQRRGLADPAVDPVVAASMLGGMIESFTMLWFFHGVEYDEDSAVETLTRLWAQSLGLRLTAEGQLDERYTYASRDVEASEAEATEV
jgi:AcrR family transcriptional regulator